jgi:hypothetical protein
LGGWGFDSPAALETSPAAAGAALNLVKFWTVAARCEIFREYNCRDFFYVFSGKN